jgi:thioesterase domain-containing protein
VFKANFRAIGSARHGPIAGNLAVIRTEGGFPPELLQFESGDAVADSALGWRDLVQGRLVTHTMPGDHLAMLDAANLPSMASILIELARDGLAEYLHSAYGERADPKSSPTALWRAIRLRQGT